jgi:type VI protein secretion system component VasF
VLAAAKVENMTPLDLCEPLFLFVCKVNRSKRKGGPTFEPQQLRTEVEKILRDMAKQSYADRDLTLQYNALKPVLLAFVDLMAEQALPGRWQSLTPGDQATAADDFFFAQLEATLPDASGPARQRLAVFYTCLCLGAGASRHDARFLTEKIHQVTGHIQEFMDLDEKKKLCVTAYQNTDERCLEPPLAQRLTSLGILLVGLLLIAFLANAMLYRQKMHGLNDILNSVVAHNAPDAQAGKSGT